MNNNLLINQKQNNIFNILLASAAPTLRRVACSVHLFIAFLIWTLTSCYSITIGTWPVWMEEQDGWWLYSPPHSFQLLPAFSLLPSDASWSYLSSIALSCPLTFSFCCLMHFLMTYSTHPCLRFPPPSPSPAAFFPTCRSLNHHQETEQGAGKRAVDQHCHCLPACQHQQNRRREREGGMGNCNALTVAFVQLIGKVNKSTPNQRFEQNKSFITVECFAIGHAGRDGATCHLGKAAPECWQHKEGSPPLSTCHWPYSGQEESIT